MKKIYTFFLILIFMNGFSQNIKVQRVCVAFLNVENLWDTVPSADYIDGTKPIGDPNFHRSVDIDSIKNLPKTEDYKGPWSDSLLIGKKVVRYQSINEDFTANGPKRNTSEVFNHKIHNIAKVVSELGKNYTKSAPAIVGLIEVENRQVVQAITLHPLLIKENYQIIHYNSFDPRGIDVALLYNPKRFSLIKSYKKEVKLFNDENGNRQYTRDILVAIGLLDGEKVGFFMNHWPSRSGGEALSQPKRIAAAHVLKTEMDLLRTQIPGIKLIAMGDFNDDPNSQSLKKYLGAVEHISELSAQKPYYNPMWKMFRAGVASLAYKDAPNLFDQIILSENLISKAPSISADYKFFKAEIFAPNYLKNTEGQYKGYPFRSWSGDRYTGGYSDHFPAISVFQKEVKTN